MVFPATTFAMAAGPIAVTTYHYDSYRAGWNANENGADTGECGRRVLRNSA